MSELLRLVQLFGMWNKRMNIASQKSVYMACLMNSENTTLHKLNLGKNKIGDAGAAGLASGLRHVFAVENYSYFPFGRDT